MSHYSKTRSPAVAGMFYPADPAKLRRQIDSFFIEDSNLASVPKALIVPHAGYIYSGMVAASAYERILPAKDNISRIVLLGPSHRVPLYGLAAPEVERFQTPLGEVDLDTSLIRQLVNSFSQVQISDLAHEEEHSLEVQLPFLQSVLADFYLVPLVVGDASEEQVAEVINHLWGEKDCCIVISSDLSHFHTYEQAKHLDLETAKTIESLEGSELPDHSACGRIPIAGMLSVARQRKMRIERFDLCNSGDTAGDHHQVVGYGAWGLFES